jgi:hypothetical protein
MSYEPSGYAPPPPPGYGPPPPPPGYGYPPGPPPPGYGYPPPYGPGPSAMPIAAGALMLVGGILALIFGIIAMIGAIFLSAWSSELGVEEYTSGYLIWMWIEIIMLFIAGVFGLVGGVQGIRRRGWGICMVSSIILIACGWPMIIPLIMGIIALILVAISKKDFF